MNYEERLQDLLDELDLFQDWTERYEYIISLGKKLPRLDEAYKTEDSLIKGCQSRVWLHTEPDNGVLKLYADSDSLITKGLIAVFIRLLSGLPPGEILQACADGVPAAGLFHQSSGLYLAWAELSRFPAGETVLPLYFSGAHHVL